MADEATKQTAAGIDASTLLELRSRIEAERERLLAMLVTEEENTPAAAPEDPLTSDVRDFGEQGQDLTNEDTELALEENDRRLLEQVNKALRRMDDGAYGLSEVTGKPIPLERLQALPWATKNVGD